MKENKTLNEYFIRFMELVNQMRSYGDSIDDQWIVDKNFSMVPENFDPIVAVIEETKELSQLSI